MYAGCSAKAARKAKEAAERVEEAARNENSMAEEARRFMNEEESNEVPENVEVTVENIVENNNNIIEKRSRNKKDISNIALASIRHHTGLRETAEIATAAWIDGGLITEDDTHLVIDHNKVKRAQDKIMAELNEKFEEELKVKGISCIFSR